MRKDDRGLAPDGGILVDDAASAVSGGVVRQQPAGSREAASGNATTEGGSTIAKPSGGAAEPVAASEPGAGPGQPPAADEETRPHPRIPTGAEKPRPAAESDVPAATDRGPSGADAGAGTAGAGAGRNAGHNAGQQASVAVRTSGVVARRLTDTPEPSWAQVLATTIRLWVSRRLRRIGIGRRRPPHPAPTTFYGEPPARTRSGSAWRWRLAAIVLAVAILALVGLQLSGVLNKPGSAGGPAANPGNGSTSSLSAAAAARTQAAAWVAQQVGSDNIVACDPVVCSALLGQGIPAGRLLPLQSAGANPFGADVIVASPSVRSEFGGELTGVYAPALIASFGSGAIRVDVRAIADQGGAAYRAAEQPDLTARKTAGAQLLHNPRFRATPQAARQITAGQVDSRLLVTLASLAGQRAVSVSSFSDTGPAAPVQFREVTITSPGGQDAALTADLDQVRTQRAPYLPENANIVHPGGLGVLRIEFGAPNPQGILTGGNS